MISEVLNSATTAAVAAATGAAPAAAGGGTATPKEVKDGTDTRTAEEKAKAEQEAKAKAGGDGDFFSTIWGKIKSFFGEDGVDMGGLLGGAVGVLGAWIVSGMFGGSGMLGTIGFLLLAIPAFMMAKNGFGDMFNTLINGGEKPTAEAPGKAKVVSNGQGQGAEVEAAPTRTAEMDPGLKVVLDTMPDYRPGSGVVYSPNAASPSAPNVPVNVGVPSGGFTPNPQPAR